MSASARNYTHTHTHTHTRYAPVGTTLGNSWRIAGDCNGWDTIYNAIRVNEALASYAGPGGWNVSSIRVYTVLRARSGEN